MIIRTRARAELLLAGLTNLTESAAEMLKLQPLDAGLPTDRRLKDGLVMPGEAGQAHGAICAVPRGWRWPVPIARMRP